MVGALCEKLERKARGNHILGSRKHLQIQSIRGPQKLGIDTQHPKTLEEFEDYKIKASRKPAIPKNPRGNPQFPKNLMGVSLVESWPRSCPARPKIPSFQLVCKQPYGIGCCSISSATCPENSPTFKAKQQEVWVDETCARRAREIHEGLLVMKVPTIYLTSAW